MPTTKKQRNKKKICMILTSNLVCDTRVLNEARVLGKYYKLIILSPSDGTSEKYNKFGFKVEKVIYRKSKNIFINKIFILWALAKKTFKENPDVYHAHDLDGLCCAFFPSLYKKALLIYDSHELWVDSINTKLYPFLKPIIILIEKIMVRQVKIIFTINYTIAKYLEERYKKPSIAIYNYPRMKNKKAVALKKQYNKKIILYLGALSQGRELKNIIKSSLYLDSNYLILLIGYGKMKKELEEQIDKLNLSQKVKILEPFDPDKIKNSIEGVDVGLCLIERMSLSYYYSSPNKLFQYINAGVPILASSFPEMEKIINDNNIGMTISHKNPKIIAESIIQMTQKHKIEIYKKNLMKIKNKFIWDQESKKLVLAYRNLFHE